MNNLDKIELLNIEYFESEKAILTDLIRKNSPNYTFLQKEDNIPFDLKEKVNREINEYFGKILKSDGIMKIKLKDILSNNFKELDFSNELNKLKNSSHFNSYLNKIVRLLTSYLLELYSYMSYLEDTDDQAIVDLYSYEEDYKKRVQDFQIRMDDVNDNNIFLDRLLDAAFKNNFENNIGIVSDPKFEAVRSNILRVDTDYFMSLESDFKNNLGKNKFLKSIIFFPKEFILKSDKAFTLLMFFDLEFNIRLVDLSKYSDFTSQGSRLDIKFKEFSELFENEKINNERFAWFSQNELSKYFEELKYLTKNKSKNLMKYPLYSLSEFLDKDISSENTNSNDLLYVDFARMNVYSNTTEDAIPFAVKKSTNIDIDYLKENIKLIEIDYTLLPKVLPAIIGIGAMVLEQYFKKFSIENFLKERIIVPPLTIQKDFIISKLKEANNESLQVNQTELKGDFDLFQHSVNGSLLNINNHKETLELFFKENKKIANTKIDDEFEDTLKSQIMAVFDNTTDIENTIKNFTTFKLLKVDMKEFDITEFIKEYKYDSLDIIKVNNIEDFRNIIGDQSKIKIILDNLIRNAKEHAFMDFNDNKVKIEVNFKNNRIVISVCNNGKPFKISQEEFIRRNFTTKKAISGGTGGYLMNEIMIKHNGKLILKKDLLETEYTTCIDLEFRASLNFEKFNN